ncbi:hypothetical protein Hanom_Chr17g01533491 [Helianthus anomalus]
MICCIVAWMWLLTVLALMRFSFAVGIELASTCSPTVNRHPPPDSAVVVVEVEVMLPLGFCPNGIMTNPKGRRGMHDGSPPFIVSLMASTSTVEYTTRLPESSVQLSCSTSSTFCDELLATWY